MAHRRKTLSQNFLHNPETIARVIRAARVGAGDLVVEPGPGEGALTGRLAGRARRLIAYELDPALAARLDRRLGTQPHVRVQQGDFLRTRPPREPFAVVGNIPYSRTSDIVRWCLSAPALTSATLVTQLEYARKRTGDYGRWTLQTVQSWPEHEWRLLARISRRDFTPVPRTDSALLRIDRRTEPLLPRRQLSAYRDFTAHAFTGTGGSVQSTLAARHSRRQVRSAFRHLGLPPSALCGQLTPEQWLSLFTELRGRRPD